MGMGACQREGTFFYSVQQQQSSRAASVTVATVGCVQGRRRADRALMYVKRLE